MKDRQQATFDFRVNAAKLARDRNHPEHRANGEEQRYAGANYAMSFTKGLKHNRKTGLICDPTHFEAFRKAIDDAFIDPFTLNVPVAPEKRRGWEAPTAGVAHDLEGPDAQAVTMPPAPELGSKELAYEMAEVYEMALLRDNPLTQFQTPAGNPPPPPPVAATIGRLNGIDYAIDGSEGRPRKNTKGALDEQTLFRGSSPGVEAGPYLSQFLLIGGGCLEEDVESGMIDYGANSIDQRVPVASKEDYMTEKDDYIDVQNGANPCFDNGCECDDADDKSCGCGNAEDGCNDDCRCSNPCVCDPCLRGDCLGVTLDPDANPKRRFISTPRDLATYVHVDALYQAYLNACIILLNSKVPFDPGFGALSGQAPLYHLGSKNRRQAEGFALYGGPHVLTLVTEVATRALKAVRYQKFNNHLRLRPEALAARIHYRENIRKKVCPDFGKKLTTDLYARIGGTVAAISGQSGTELLPMAFKEGSPMHPSYGAGHATVAGACVTVLKAFFDTSTVFVKRKVKSKSEPEEASTVVAFRRCKRGDEPIAYTSDFNIGKGVGNELVESNPDKFLTLEGELNKLAANISIARNMAGVHYFSDYYDSVRMGEEIAIGILEEQALGYPTDRFVMSLTTFDGRSIRIGRR